MSVLVQLDPSTNETLAKAFAQCGVQTLAVAEDFSKRLGVEQFQGCVVLLDDHAPAVLEAVRSSRSNHKMILYGILPRDVDVRRFSKFGLNTLIESPVNRGNALSVARATCSLLLHELRRYVRIPLVIEVSIESPAGNFSGSRREISGGGMSVELSRYSPLSGRLRLTSLCQENHPPESKEQSAGRKARYWDFNFKTPIPPAKSCGTGSTHFSVLISRISKLRIAPKIAEIICSA